MSDQSGIRRRFGLQRRLLATLRSRFSLREDREEPARIDEDMRAGVVMRGTNLWVLMFAIVIASVGLNVNSTAVVIGAMLISPLMGPILGIGYGVGIVDVELIRDGLKNLALASATALLTSAAYFLVSPLHAAQSELLARTAPSIWDVLIAASGGLAGIIGVTRKQKSTVIPGVAIATALMPPLCTAGFGLATAQWRYLFGALYLFAINCVFIAAAAAVVIGAFRLPRHHYVDRGTEKRMQRYLAGIVLVTLLPSLYLAYLLVRQEVFRTRAAEFVHQQLAFSRTHVEAIRIDPLSRQIQVSLLGDAIPRATIDAIAARLPLAGLADAKLEVFQAGDQRIDVAALKSSLLADLYRDSQRSLAERQKTIDDLRSRLEAQKTREAQLRGVPAELHALYPEVDDVALSEGSEWRAADGFARGPTVIVVAHAAKPIAPAERARLEAWLRARAAVERVRLVIDTGPNPAPAGARTDHAARTPAGAHQKR